MTDEGDPSYILLQHCPTTAIIGCDLSENGPITVEDNSSLSVEFYTRDQNGVFELHERAEFYDSNDYMDDVSYYYSAPPSFLPGGYQFPSIGPRAAIGQSTGQGTIPASDRYGTSPRHFDHGITPIPPLEIDIEAPHSIPGAQQVTLEAISDGGVPSLHYTWEHRWISTGGGGGPIDPFLFSEFSGGGVIPMAPMETWNTVGTDSEILVFQVGGDSEFRVTVRDAIGASVVVYHTIDTPGGGVYDPNMADNSNLNKFSEENLTSISLKNYPNPFNPSTIIKFGLPEVQNVSIEIYNTLGERVRALLNEIRGPGYHEVMWNGKDAAGRSVSSGMYLYVLKTNSKRIVKKMFLTK